MCGLPSKNNVWEWEDRVAKLAGLEMSEDGKRAIIDVLQALRTRLSQFPKDQLPEDRVIIIQLCDKLKTIQRHGDFPPSDSKEDMQDYKWAHFGQRHKCPPGFMCIEQEDMIGDTMHAGIQICPHVVWDTVHKRCKDKQTAQAAMDAMELIRLAAANKLRTATEMFFAAFLDIATVKDVTPYMHEVALYFPRWMELHGNLDALSAQSMEHCNKEIKEGFRKGSNHKPQRMLKCGKVTLSRTGQVMKCSTLMAHHRDMHGPTHQAYPHMPKVKADAVKAEMAEKAAKRRKI
eukprot:jgi/Tetstr1/444486/TSEL_032367.t1